MMMVKNSSLFMGMTKMKVMALMALLFSFGAGAQEYTWEAVPIDGSMTGCRTAGVKDVPEALGRIDDSGTYISPSGRVFPATSSTAGVAALLIDAQSYMSDVKQVIGHSAAEMPNARYETQLSNWFVSILKDKVEVLYGRNVDIAIANFGGIRIGMPDGDIILDDMLSMFPFRNTLVYLEMKGSELRKVFQKMAAGKFEAVGGVRIEVVDKALVKVEVGNEPLCDDKIYGVATISFLLHGGDGLYLADGALRVDESDVLIIDAVLEYIRDLTAEGKSVTPPDVKHVIIR